MQHQLKGKEKVGLIRDEGEQSLGNTSMGFGHISPYKHFVILNSLHLALGRFSVSLH